MQIAVIIPTFQRPECLDRALRSIGPEAASIIVVDDASGSNCSEAVLRACQSDARVQLMRNESRQGAAACRNIGAQKVDADWLLFLDDDDQLTDGYLSASLQMICAAPEVNAWVPAYVGAAARPKGTVTPRHIQSRNLVGGCSGLLIRRSLFESVGGFDPALRSMQDWDLWIRLIQRDALYFSGLTGVLYSKSSTHKITHDLTAKYSGLRHLFFKHRAFWSNEARRAHLIRLWALRQLIDRGRGALYPCIKRVFTWPTAFGYCLKWRHFVD